MAVTSLAIALYIPIWGFFAAALLIVVSLPLLLIECVRTMPFPRTTDSKQRTDNVLGAVALSVVLLVLLSTIVPSPVAKASSVRWLVYTTDYYVLANYPGVRPDERVRLHENGIVSYALPNAGDIEIRVRKLESP